MTPTRFISKSTSRIDWYNWFLVDLDTGRELDRGGASRRVVATEYADQALAKCKRRLLEGPPTEAVEVEMVEMV